MWQGATKTILVVTVSSVVVLVLLQVKNSQQPTHTRSKLSLDVCEYFSDRKGKDLKSWSRIRHLFENRFVFRFSAGGEREEVNAARAGSFLVNLPVLLKGNLA